MHFFGHSPWTPHHGEKSRWRQIVWPIITQSTLTQSCKHFLGRLLWCDGWWWDDHQLVDIPPPQMISFWLDRFFIAICENFSPTQFSASVSKRFHRIPNSISFPIVLKNLKSCISFRARETTASWRLVRNEILHTTVILLLNHKANEPCKSLLSLAFESKKCVKRPSKYCFPRNILS